MLDFQSRQTLSLSWLRIRPKKAIWTVMESVRRSGCRDRALVALKEKSADKTVFLGSIN